MKKQVIPSTLGERVRRRRRELDMTQRQLADEAGLSTQFIYSIEHGRQGVRTENLVKLAATLEVSTDMLLTGVANDRDAHYLNGVIQRLGSKEFQNLRSIIEHYCDSYASPPEAP